MRKIALPFSPRDVSSQWVRPGKKTHFLIFPPESTPDTSPVPPGPSHPFITLTFPSQTSCRHRSPRTASLWSEQAHCRPVEGRGGKSELSHPEWRRLSVMAETWEDSRSLGLKQGDHVPVCSDLGMARDLKGSLFEGHKDSSARQTHTWISTKYQSMWISQK